MAGRKKSDPPRRKRPPAKTRARSAPVAITQNADTIDVAKLAKSHAEIAIGILIAMMKDDAATPAARISAANTLLQWASGRGRISTNAEAAGEEKIVRLYWAAPGETDSDDGSRSVS